MSILFTQYYMPNGRQKHKTFDSDPKTEKLAHEMLDFGFTFDVEILSTGMISMTCMAPDKEETCLASEISTNGPEVVEKVQSLVRNAYQYWQDHKKKFPGWRTNWRGLLAGLEAERKYWMGNHE